jgi:indolepyruvate ferredoxin oxidoreductase alpha subunit
MRHSGVTEKIFAVIGDSTFFHAGMPGLLNIAYNKANICVVILDNQVTAMTGHQPTPETGKNILGEKTKVIKIENVVKSLGIEKVKVVDPYDIKETRRVIMDTVDYNGPSVIISRRSCTLLVDNGTVRHVTEECDSCGECINVLGCPAISMTLEGANIDETLCRGCGVCETICPINVIRSEQTS